jgi:hypothetical protein
LGIVLYARGARVRLRDRESVASGGTHR